MEMPLVSLIIPTFNRETLIQETLDSVISQTYSNWEIIVVDDGSTDNTLQIMENYSKDLRIKIFKRDREPRGAPTCRNIGIEKSNGDYILFLDSDDILFPHALMERAKFLLNHSDLDFCVADGIRGQYPIQSENKYYLISTFKSKDVLPQFFNFTVPWIWNTMFIRKSLLANEITWSENLKAFQDVDFNIKCVLAGLKFDYCKHEIDCLWREHNQGNIGGNELNNNLKKFEQRIALLKNVISYPNLNNEDITPFYAYCIRFFLNSNTQVKSAGDFFLYLYKNPIKRYFFKTLFTTYRWVYKNKIKKIKGLFYILIIKLKQGKYLISQDNKHFMTELYFPKKG